LALVGGPVVEGDYDVLDWVERSGGRIVLDASECGERTLPRPFEPVRMLSRPFEELVDAYFGIPDVFRRPNDPVYEYLGREIAARRVRGVVFRRYLWCDLWHAELARLKAWSPVPVLDLDVSQSESGAEARTVGRIEAFLETLNPGP
jgi:benzoyl-CoA reductase/2-hydroxyglutaryl-CoA dehydratase subunit BcrC/BadD/HgdB